MANPSTSNQVAMNSILDAFNRQNYLGQAFVVTLPSTTISTTSETPLLLITNAATNTKALFMTLKKLTCLTASQSAYINVYVNPTVTSNGTPITPVNMRTGSATSSVASAFTSPTVSANGTLVDLVSSPAFSVQDSKLMNVVDPNASILVTVVVSANSTKVNATLSWFEL